MTKHHTPPGFTSILCVVVVKPRGPHHFTTCSGSVQASNTRAGAALIRRVMTISRSVGILASAFMASMPLAIFVAAGGASLPAALAAPKRSPQKKPAAAKNPGELKAGQFEWLPERSPSGPLAIIVSLTKQRVYVYRNGIKIGVSTCSTGKNDYDTPTGVFTILQKEEEHYSKTYDDAPMPMMQRLTWDGIALHAGKLPGYPASHGCVRLPKAFAEKLYEATQV